MASPPTGFRFKARRVSVPGVLAGAIDLLFGQSASLTNAGGGTTYTTDGSQSDVQSKINSAASGDTVEIPSGTYNWASGITISGKAITLRGAGGGWVQGSSRTSLAIGTGSKTFTLHQVDGGNTWLFDFTTSETIRAQCKYNSSLWMEGSVTSWNSSTRELVINVSSTGGSGTIACWTFVKAATTKIVHNAGSSNLFEIDESTAGNVRIQDMHIAKGTGSGYGIFIGPVANGKAVVLEDCRMSDFLQCYRNASHRGVVARCYFDQGFNWENTGGGNNANGVHFEMQETLSDAWEDTHYMGTADTNGDKNNYTEDCYFHGYILGVTDYHNSTRGVFRYNIVDNGGLTTHGPDTAAEGLRHVEVYNNVFIFDAPAGGNDERTPNLNYHIHWRGGSGIFTDNKLETISSTAWGSKNNVKLDVQMIRRNSGPYACWTGGYPVPRQIGQGHNGTNAVTEGCYIWNNTSGMSIGVDQYEPDECGNGLLASDYIQASRDYFTSSKSGYTKYTYPHPDRSS